MKIILTGATGYVGEGTLLELLKIDSVDKVLSVSRKPTGIVHPKLEEYIVPDFMQLAADDEHFKGYDAVFFHRWHNLSWHPTRCVCAHISRNSSALRRHHARQGKDDIHLLEWSRHNRQRKTILAKSEKQNRARHSGERIPSHFRPSSGNYEMGKRSETYSDDAISVSPILSSATTFRPSQQHEGDRAIPIDTDS